MKLSEYMAGILSRLTDSRAVTNATNLAQKIIEHQTLRLWTISETRAEYERGKRLLDGSLKSVLDDKQIAQVLREKGAKGLGDQGRLLVLHDPCDIRKEYAVAMEKIGSVRDLDGELINGYQTFNTVVIDEGARKLYPVDITVYSNGDEHYVTRKELKFFGQGKLPQSGSVADQQRAAQIEQFVADESYLNLSRLTEQQLSRVSQAFKEQNPEMILCHVLDRQFDGVNYFEFIDQELGDEFVIRAKVSRNSNEVRDNSETNKRDWIKLKTVEFACRHQEILNKVLIKKKVYQQVKCLIEWDTLTLDDHPYTVVRITLLDRKGKPIYKNPMLLITNIPIKNVQQAQAIYRTYLLRAKIEAVFKFLKNTLGWEEFQLRDYESIKNIIALGFFIGGYFYEIEHVLADNPTIQLIAQLGGGKGNVTRHYFLQGLKQILIFQSVQHFINQQQINDDTLSDILAFVT